MQIHDSGHGGCRNGDDQERGHKHYNYYNYSHDYNYVNVMSSEVRRLQVSSKGLAATVDPSISPGATKIF